MHLQKLEIQGFKSFAEKTTFLFPGQQDGGYGITAVIGPNGSGKCVHGDSRVVLSDGHIATIKELVDSSLNRSRHVERWDDGYCSYENTQCLQVLSLNPGTLKIEPRPIQAFIKRTAPKELFRITTKGGRSLVATGYHPLFTLEGGELKTITAEQLKPGVRIAIPRKLPVEKTSDHIDFTRVLSRFERDDSVYVPHSSRLEQWVGRMNGANGGQTAFARHLGINPIHMKGVRDRQAVNLGTIRRFQEQWHGPLDEWFDYRIKSSGTGHMVVPRSLTPALARILGYCVSEGRLTRVNQVWFVNSDAALIDDFCQCVRETFNLEARVLTYKPSTKDVIVFSHTLCHYLEKAFQLGIEQPSAKKQVPDAIFSASDDVVKSFLSALFEGDGHVCYRSGKRTTAYIEYSTASERLAGDVSILLARFGIVARVSSKWKAATNTEKKIKRQYFSVTIYGIEQLKIATSLFHFRGEKKRAMEKLKTLDFAVNPNYDVIPGATQLVRDLVKTSAVSVKRSRKECPTLAAYTEQRCEATRPGLKRVLEAVRKYGNATRKGDDIYNRLETLSSSDAYWDSIASVERVEHEEWVYDLAVEGHHNFIANGMVVHNSNVADAVRWVLGEQSLKLLRSKRAEDVIFFGSSQKAQKGFCEVSLYFNNEDRAFPVDFAEAVITRRLYRDGASEYLLNKNKVRLSDIALMLAQAHIGQRSYSVIGQGMIDAILQTAPSERKEFFSEAVGVRQYQIKRDSAALKLKSTNENLTHALTVLSELEPKMKFFARQLKRLEEREEVEREYSAIQKQYTNALWNDLAVRKEGFEKEKEVHEKKIADLVKKQHVLEDEFSTNEQGLRKDEFSPFHALSQKITNLQNGRQQILTRLLIVGARLQTELVAEGMGQIAWLSGRRDELAAKLTSINEELSAGKRQDDRLAKQEEGCASRIAKSHAGEYDGADAAALQQTFAELETIGRDAAKSESLTVLKDALMAIVGRVAKLKEMAIALIARAQGGAVTRESGVGTLREELQSARTQREILAARMMLWEEEREKTTAEHEQTARELAFLSAHDLSDQHARALAEKEELVVQRAEIEKTIASLQEELDGLYEAEKETHRTLLEQQKEMNMLSKEHDTVRDELNRACLEIAKLEAHQEELISKICDELRVDDSVRSELVAGTETVYATLGFLQEAPLPDRDGARQHIDRLKRKLEQIGTIDADVIAEHEETRSRYEFLNGQVTDLTEARESLEGALIELDAIIQERFEKNLEGISKKFSEYFAQLFGGGSARLIVLRKERVLPDAKDADAKEDVDEEEDGERSDDAIAGIEIEATPPGKKFKHLGFLSGGEKALTAIALLCAILAQNPSPFVILDEVDAALDESNANRFAAIIQDLSTRTQFILITHNRITMCIGNALYGVTMTDEGISHCLSLDIRQLDGIVTEK